MTTPDGYVPEEARTVSDVKDLQNLNEAAIKKQLQQPAVNLFEQFKGNQLELLAGVVNFLGSSIISDWIPVSSSEVSLVGGQVLLNDRVQLLDGVRGFCMAYQSLNINAAWGNGGTRRLPFDQQYGPAKGAEIYGDGIRLLEAGAWRLDAMVRARSTAFTGNDGALMDIIVERPDGSIYLRSRYNAWPGTGTESIYGGRPLVVDEPGFRVRVEVWSGRWRWWDGGDMFTFLSAVKYDNRSNHSGQSTVPDEAEPTG